MVQSTSAHAETRAVITGFDPTSLAWRLPPNHVIMLEFSCPQNITNGHDIKPTEILADNRQFIVSISVCLAAPPGQPPLNLKI
jgi:hypothetical protein